MTTKERLLLLLENSRGLYLSGEEVSRSIGVSRAAIGKAVHSLRDEGASIEAKPGRGYLLPMQSDHLSREALQAQPNGTGFLIRVLKETASTNLEAKRWAMEGAPNGSLVIAEKQSEGRGRLGRRFESPVGGVYFSLILRPPAGAPPMLFTAAAAVATCQSVSRLCGRELQIKWVNDLYWKGKKCCGILTEASSGMETGTFEYVVVGIGLNYAVSAESFPAALNDTGISLYPDAAPPVSRAALAVDIRSRLMQWTDNRDVVSFMEEYRRRSFVVGRDVTVLAVPPYDARAIAIDDDASLVVRTADGKERKLSAGEISILPKRGKK